MAGFSFNNANQTCTTSLWGKIYFLFRPCSTQYSTSQIFYPLLFYYVFLHSTSILMSCHVMPTSHLGGVDPTSNRCPAVFLYINHFSPTTIFFLEVFIAQNFWKQFNGLTWLLRSQFCLSIYLGVFPKALLIFSVHKFQAAHRPYCIFLTKSIYHLM